MKKTISFRVPPEVADWIKREAGERNMTPSGLARVLLIQVVKSSDRGTPFIFPVKYALSGAPRDRAGSGGTLSLTSTFLKNDLLKVP